MLHFSNDWMQLSTLLAKLRFVTRTRRSWQVTETPANTVVVHPVTSFLTCSYRPQFRDVQNRVLVTKSLINSSLQWVDITYIFWWNCVLKRSKDLVLSGMTRDCKGQHLKPSCDEDLNKSLNQEQRHGYPNFQYMSTQISSRSLICLQWKQLNQMHQTPFSMLAMLFLCLLRLLSGFLTDR